MQRRDVLFWTLALIHRSIIQAYYMYIDRMTHILPPLDYGGYTCSIFKICTRRVFMRHYFTHPSTFPLRRNMRRSMKDGCINAIKSRTMVYVRYSVNKEV